QGAAVGPDAVYKQCQEDAKARGCRQRHAQRDREGDARGRHVSQHTRHAGTQESCDQLGLLVWSGAGWSASAAAATLAGCEPSTATKRGGASALPADSTSAAISSNRFSRTARNSSGSCVST